MSDKTNCQKLYDELDRIKEKRAEFGRVYEDGLNNRDFDECRGLFREIRNLLDGPDTEIGRLRAMNIAPELNHLKLHEQYESQLEVAWKSGLFGTPKSVHVENPAPAAVENPALAVVHKLPVIERGGKKYPMPSWQEVQKTLRKPEIKEIIKEKSAQGFTKMLIVPFGYDLKNMSWKFKEKVRELDQQGLNPDGSSNPNKGIFGAGGEKVEFNREDGDYPVYLEGWDENKLVYYPKQYDQKKHGGMNKEDAIKINGAWQVCFVEDMPVIPLEGKEIGGRKQIDRNGSCIKGQTEIPEVQQYHAAMQNKKKMAKPAKYRHEKGPSPEQYLWMQLTSLLDNEKPVLLDYENNVERGTYLTESYNIHSLTVPFVSWFRDDSLIYLSVRAPNDNFETYGIRPSVSIK